MKLNKKGAFTVKSLIIGMIFISMFSLGWLAWIDEATQSTEGREIYNITISAPYNKTSENIRTTFNELESFSETASGVQNSTISSSDLGGIVGIGRVWETVKLIFEIPIILIKVLTNLSVSLGLPSWLIPGIIAALLVFLAFALIKVVFKVEV